MVVCLGQSPNLNPLDIRLASMLAQCVNPIVRALHAGLQRAMLRMKRGRSTISLESVDTSNFDHAPKKSRATEVSATLTDSTAKICSPSTNEGSSIDVGISQLLPFKAPEHGANAQLQQMNDTGLVESGPWDVEASLWQELMCFDGSLGDIQKEMLDIDTALIEELLSDHTVGLFS